MVFGIASLIVFALSGVVFAFSAAYGIINPVFGAEGSAPDIINYFGMFVLAPAIAVFGGALPARALGANWFRSLLISTIVMIIFIWAALWGDSMLPLVIVTVLAPVLIALAGSPADSLTAAGVWTVLIVSAILLFLSILVSLGQGDGIGLLAGAFAWIVLPAIAGLFQPCNDEPEN
jgi:hypothetical protein